jgi:transcriptional regulator with XRE-family HTH domain
LSSFALNIKELRLEKKLSRAELATYLGVTESAIYGYEQGRSTPNISVAIALANLFSVSLDKLFGRKSDSIDISNIPVVDAGDVIAKPKGKSLDTVPMLYLQQAANAGTASATDFTKGTPFLLPGNKKEGLVMLDVKGDSMLPTIVDGDRVICEQITDPLSVAYQGITVVVGRDGSVLIKMLTLDKDSYILTSLNSMYPVARFAKEDVVQLWRPVLLLTSRLFS